MWDNVEDFEVFELIPEGKYPANIIDCQMKETKNGDEYMNIELQIQEPEKYMKNRVFDNIFYHSEGSKKRAKYFFLKIGLDKIIEANKMPTPQDVCGCKCIVDIEHEEYNGRDRAKPSFFGYHRVGEGHKKIDKKDDDSTPSASVKAGWTDNDMGEPPF